MAHRLDVRPELVVLDVNETLSDLAPLAAVFADVGLRSDDVEAWFAGVLRDGIALSMLGDSPAFAELAAGGVAVRLQRHRPGATTGELAEAGERVVSAFVGLAPHPDVVDGLRALGRISVRAVTLSNGSADVARRLLGDAEGLVEDYLSVVDVGTWKPAPEVYTHALRQTGTEAGRSLMVAVHPWDLEGARRAGLRTAWLDRRGEGWPGYFEPPDVQAPSLTRLADVLAELPAS